MNAKKPNARDRILKAANKVFAERGYSDTTISDIAKTANVSEASVYQHFSGKEELFFAIPTKRIEEGLPYIEEHLFGVKDALDQLRIFIWIYVRALTEDRDHGRLILLHLKTNKTFLRTGAYKEAQRFFGKITQIIESGQKSGEIRPEINPHTARSLVLGSIENLLTRWFLKDCSYDLWPYIEEAYSLIEDILRERPELHIRVTYEPSNVVCQPGGRAAPHVASKRQPTLQGGVQRSGTNTGDQVATSTTTATKKPVRRRKEQ